MEMPKKKDAGMRFIFAVSFRLVDSSRTTNMGARRMRAERKRENPSPSPSKSIFSPHTLALPATSTADQKPKRMNMMMAMAMMRDALYCLVNLTRLSIIYIINV